MKNSSKNTGNKSKVFVYRYYLIAAILFITAISWTMIQSSGCSKASSYQSKSDSTRHTSVVNNTQSNKQQETNTDSKSNKEETTEQKSDETKDVFNPQDVSDQTIQSIQTYDDYLKMYYKIIENYFSDYEAVVKGTVLYDETAFQKMKESIEQAYDSQVNQYDAIRNNKIIGKDELVKYLIEYRDGLQKTIDTLKKSLQ